MIAILLSLAAHQKRAIALLIRPSQLDRERAVFVRLRVSRRHSWTRSKEIELHALSKTRDAWIAQRVPFAKPVVQEVASVLP